MYVEKKVNHSALKAAAQRDHALFPITAVTLPKTRPSYIYLKSKEKKNKKLYFVQRKRNLLLRLAYFFYVKGSAINKLLPQYTFQYTDLTVTSITVLLYGFGDCRPIIVPITVPIIVIKLAYI